MIAKQDQSAVPAALVDVALIDSTACAATGAMSISWWLEEVRAGRAPQPVIREARCTRWRMTDVHAFWAKRAAQGLDPQTAAGVTAKAKKASDAAKAKRQAAPAIAA